ncbi:MAG: nucleotidyltransferase family protein [Clostridiales bacterium]|nr:nucleotidyltransferase family protein [Clostridiales bacterium]
MEKHEEQFLYLLKKSVYGETVPADYQFDAVRVFCLSEIHNVTPLIYSVCCSCDCAKSFKSKTVTYVGLQIQRNLRFLRLYDSMCKSGLDPIILKGPVCASLYPQPDYRISSDFDVFVSPENENKTEKFLIKSGFDKTGNNYISDELGLYIEIHTDLSEGESVSGLKTSDIFSHSLDNTTLYGEYKSLSYTDNMIYLIYHAFKHFIKSGFGVRQILDIAFFADKYKSDIDFERVFSSLAFIKADIFAYNVFYAAEKCFDFRFSFMGSRYDKNIIFFDDFISDVLSAGVFGSSSHDRLHSAQMVSSAVSVSGERHISDTLFPPYSTMKNKYKILKYLPVLLPVFWIWRIVVYCCKVIFGKNNISPKKTVAIADERISLMKKMKIIS